MINPIVFYLVDLLDTLDTICSICGFVCGVVSGVLWAFVQTGEIRGYDDEKKANRFSKVFAAAFVVLLVLVIAIPSKQAMVEMLIAKYATTDNAKALIDYIVETWTSLK